MKGLTGPSRVVGLAALGGGAAVVVHILASVAFATSWKASKMWGRK